MRKSGNQSTFRQSMQHALGATYSTQQFVSSEFQEVTPSDKCGSYASKTGSDCYCKDTFWGGSWLCASTCCDKKKLSQAPGGTPSDTGSKSITLSSCPDGKSPITINKKLHCCFWNPSIGGWDCDVVTSAG